MTMASAGVLGLPESGLEMKGLPELPGSVAHTPSDPVESLSSTTLQQEIASPGSWFRHQHRAHPHSIFNDIIGPCCKIDKTEHRAITINQLRKIRDHVRRRLEEQEELWQVRRPAGTSQISRIEEVNLYDLNKYVILPATDPKDLKVYFKSENLEFRSIVEMMSPQEQKPDYFVSHWWGEPIQQLLYCLEQHTQDRGLEVSLKKSPIDHASPFCCCKSSFDGNEDYLGGRQANYWICAYANWQHKLEVEIDVPLYETPFAKAIRLAKGTVLVVDEQGTSWTRLWCVFEMYVSLVQGDEQKNETGNMIQDDDQPDETEKKTFDIYTAQENTIEAVEDGLPGDECSWFSCCAPDEIKLPKDPTRRAVGLLSGSAAIDLTGYHAANREKEFPFELLLKGSKFHCLDGQASQKDDETRITKEITAEKEKLDEKIHSIVKERGLRPALEKGHDDFLHGLGRTTKELDLNLLDSSADNEEKLQFVFDNLGTCEILDLSTEQERLPENIGELQRLQTLKLDCRNLTELPNAMNQLQALKTLSIWAPLLEELPSSVGQLESLQDLFVMSETLSVLPENLFDNSRGLQRLTIECAKLEAFPTGLERANSSLTELAIMSRALSTLPQAIGDLTELQILKLKCPLVRALPMSMSNLETLMHLDLGRWTWHSSLCWYPDLTKCKELEVTVKHSRKIADIALPIYWLMPALFIIVLLYDESDEPHETHPDFWDNTETDVLGVWMALTPALLAVFFMINTAGIRGFLLASCWAAAGYRQFPGSSTASVLCLFGVGCYISVMLASSVIATLSIVGAVEVSWFGHHYGAITDSLVLLSVVLNPFLLHLMALMHLPSGTHEPVGVNLTTVCRLASIVLTVVGLALLTERAGL